MIDHIKLEVAARALAREASKVLRDIDEALRSAVKDVRNALEAEPAQDSAPADEESHYENAQKICWCVRCSGDKEMHDVCNQQQIQRALDRVDRDGRKRTRFARREAHADCRAEMVAEVTELLAGAAPMTWVGHRDMGGAHAWEIRAAALLTKLSEADHG